MGVAHHDRAVAMSQRRAMVARVAMQETSRGANPGMIVVMKATSSDKEIQHVMKFLTNHGLSGHLSAGVERTIIGVLGAPGPSGAPGSTGGINPALGEALEGLPGVDSVLRVSKPYKLASRE